MKMGKIIPKQCINTDYRKFCVGCGSPWARGYSIGYSVCSTVVKVSSFRNREFSGSEGLQFFIYQKNTNRDGK